MAKGRAFVCNRYKNLRIRHMQFVGGLYVAKDKEEEDIIKRADGFGAYIWPQDDEPEISEEEAAALKAVEAALTPAIRQGRVGTRQ